MLTSNALRLLASTAILCGSMAYGWAQDENIPGQRTVQDFVPITDEYLQNPDPSDWVHLRGNYEGWGYSELDQINRDNVGALSLVWARAMNQIPGVNESAPVIYDGIMYLPSHGDVIYAIDAVTGDLIWEYVRNTPEEAQQRWGWRATRSIALYGDKVYTVSADNYVIALDARTGQVVWESPRGDEGLVSNSSGPIVADGVVISGSACQGFPVSGCYVTGHDAEAGEELWRNMIIPRPGDPGDETWGGIPYESRWCTGAWGQMQYDPVTDLVLYGTSGICPAPDVQRGVVGLEATLAGTNTRYAVRPQTGEIVWEHQVLPQDNWDQECVFDMVVMDTAVRPNPGAEGMLAVNPNIDLDDTRLLVGMPCKNPVFWAFDVETGEFFYARETWEGAQNLYESIDDVTGVARMDQTRVFTEQGETIFFCTTFNGGRDWPSGAYDPTRNILIQPTRDRCTNLTSRTDREPAPEFSYNTIQEVVEHPLLPSGLDYPAGRITAFDVTTGETTWQYTQRANNQVPVLATAGGLLFNGDAARYFYAIDIDTGEKIWQTRLGSEVSGYIVTYAVDGRQYVAVVSGEDAWGRGLTPEIDHGPNANMVYVFAVAE